MSEHTGQDQHEDQDQHEGEGQREDQRGEPLNDEGAGLGMDGEPNTFEPEEDPDAAEEPDDE